MDTTILLQEIEFLKEKRKAVILAHNYQRDEVQQLADYTGDSFALSKLAASNDSEVIVFCGVHFMAESASILAPDKIVLLPDPNAGCPMADMATAAELKRKKREYPKAAVVAYINSSAKIKALSDICCTSSNAIAVVNSLREEDVLFVPDQNLAAYVSLHTNKRIIPWDGYCITHHHITAEDVKKCRKAHPDAPIAVHPECRPEVVALADHVGSTAAIIEFAASCEADKIIIGTESGTLYKLRKENPNKEFILLSPDLVCPNMKLITLEKVKAALETLTPKITVPTEISKKASLTLERMLAVNREV